MEFIIKAALLICIHQLVLLSPAASISPGVKVRLSQKGLNYASQEAIKGLQLQGRTFNDVHERERRLEYRLSNMRISSYGSPTTSVQVLPGTGIKWNARGGSIKLKGDIWGKKKVFFFWLRARGRFEVDASGVDFYPSFIIEATGNGAPTVKATACQSHIGKVRVTIRGSLFSWLYNFVLQLLNGTVKKMLQEMMCKTAKDFINKEGQKYLSEIKLVRQIGKLGSDPILVDYMLTHPPEFRTHIMDTFLKGRITISNPSSTPFAPGPFASSSDSTKMFYIWISEEMVNSFIDEVFRRHLTQTTITKDNQPGTDGDFLRKNCGNAICIGNYIPTMNSPAGEIDLVSVNPMFIRITSSGMTLQANGTLALHDKAPGGSRNLLLRLQVVVKMGVTPWIDGTRLKVRVDSFNPQIQVLLSNVGTISTERLNELLALIANEFIVKSLNLIGSDGMELPDAKNIDFIDPKLQLNNGNLLVSTDLKWTP